MFHELFSSYVKLKFQTKAKPFEKNPLKKNDKPSLLLKESCQKRNTTCLYVQNKFTASIVILSLFVLYYLLVILS